MRLEHLQRRSGRTPGMNLTGFMETQETHQLWELRRYLGDWKAVWHAFAEDHARIETCVVHGPVAACHHDAPRHHRMSA